MVSDVVFDLKVDINDKNGASTTVKGEGLWRVSAWASHRPDGKGKRIGYIRQVRLD